MSGNILDGLPDASVGEVFDTLFKQGSVTIERIVSLGQATPEGEWLMQGQAEWVVVLRGRAGLLFKDQPEEYILETGDYRFIPAGTAHRVTWTDRSGPTVWLAIHYG